MKNIKSYINYLFWLIGIRKILPKRFVDSVEIKENNEPLVKIRETQRLKAVSGNKVRQSVYKMLIKASENLSDDFTLIVVEGYRSPEKQKLNWDSRFKIVKEKNPNLPIREIERITRLSVAQPVGEYGGHQTGGAVDVTLGDKQRNQLFLGTKVLEFSSKTPTDAPGLNREEKRLRKILVKTMKQAGFVNYPGEWWHYSYGDRMWAAYSRKKYCMYGPIELF